MDKKATKEKYLRIWLDYPNVEEWEKKQIRQKLGISNLVSETDFNEKTGLQN